MWSHALEKGTVWKNSLGWVSPHVSKDKKNSSSEKRKSRTLQKETLQTHWLFMLKKIALCQHSSKEPWVIDQLNSPQNEKIKKKKAVDFSIRLYKFCRLLQPNRSRIKKY